MAADRTATLRVLGESAYPASVASARVRVENYRPFLLAEGIELAFEPSLTDREYAALASAVSPVRKAAILLRSAARASRHSTSGRGGQHQLSLLHRLRLLTPAPPLDPPPGLDVYDLDDALFLSSPAQVNRRFQWVKQEARRCVSYARRARLVIAGNSFLAARMLEYAPRVEVVPTVVDPQHQPVHQHHSDRVVTVGWIGSHTTAEYLKPVLPAVRAATEGGRRAKLVVVGADTGLRESWIEHRPWSLETEAQLLAAFDIGIMPLPDSDWARGKCGYKLLQYFSAGVPAIATPVGVSGAMVGREHGLLARDQAQWRSSLEQLVGDAAMRREQGLAARAFVEREYSYTRWAPELAGMLRSLTG